MHLHLKRVHNTFPFSFSLTCTLLQSHFIKGVNNDIWQTRSGSRILKKWQSFKGYNRSPEVKPRKTHESNASLSIIQNSLGNIFFQSCVAIASPSPKLWRLLKPSTMKAVYYKSKKPTVQTNSKQKQLRWKKKHSMRHRLKRNVLIISTHKQNFCFMNISDKGNI